MTTPTSTHCDNCGCDWLDNGVNPLYCPYCYMGETFKIVVGERDKAEAEVKRLTEHAAYQRKLLDHCDKALVAALEERDRALDGKRVADLEAEVELLRHALANCQHGL